MNKKLIKSRSFRMDTLEAMVCKCVCSCSDPCANCSGGGSFYVEEHNYHGGFAVRDAKSASTYAIGRSRG